MICYLKGGYKQGSDALSLRNENRQAQWEDCRLEHVASLTNFLGKPSARTGKGMGGGLVALGLQSEPRRDPLLGSPHRPGLGPA